jgi:hypothetical protein
MRSRSWREVWIKRIARRRSDILVYSTMNDDGGELVTAMLAIVLAAVILVVGELFIVNRPTALPAILVPQQQLEDAR